MATSTKAFWWLAAAIAGVGLVLLATNPGFFHADELDAMSDAHAMGWWRWSWLCDGAQLFYRPVGYALLALQTAIGGLDAPVVHTISVLHHVANCALLALLLDRLGLDRRVAVLAFAPTWVPGIAWAAAAYDRSALTFLLLSAVALARRGAACALAAPSFALALMCKETAIGFAVPAIWIAAAMRVAPSRARVAATATIVVLAVAFAAWRTGRAGDSADYTLAIDGALKRTARYAAFPFALDCADPVTVWGRRWIGGIGTLLLAVVALRGSWRVAVAGATIAAAAMVPVVVLPKIEGHYLYLATPGVLVVVAAAMRNGSRCGRLALMALFAVATVHAFEVTTFYRGFGRAFAALHVAWRTAPADVPFVVRGEPWLGEVIVTRLEHHVRRCGLRPAVVIAPSAATAALRIDANGEIHREH